MSAQTRRFAVVDGERRVDLVAHRSLALAQVLDSAGIHRRHGQLRVVGPDVAVPGALVGDLDDGALLTVVDPTEAVVGRSRQPAVARHISGPWWAIAAVGLVTVSLALSHDAVAWPAVAAAVLGVAAGAGTLAAVRCGPADEGRVWRVFAPAVLGVAAVVVLVPRTGTGGTHLLIIAAAAVTAVVFALAATSDQGLHSRAGLVVVAVVCGGVGCVWGVVLALGWEPRAAAALVVGAVPLALRALPGALFAVPDGWLIDVERYQDTQWSVRSRPQSVLDAVDGDQVRATVRRGAAARVAGTVVLSAAGAVALPFAVVAGGASLVVRIGQVVLLVCYGTAMVLLARSVGGRHLRWVPRASGAVAIVVGLRLCALDGPVLILVAVGAIVAGLAAVGVAVLVWRGARSLVASRAGDIAETVTLVLCMPAAAVASDVLEALRTLVA
ncbi:MAG: hypothetical protein FWE61_07295 [Micrococcales bacterium]|nr:hypothetical protein [Micrococcales bacterium]